MTTNLLTVPVSILFFHKKKDKNIDMEFNSSPTNNKLSTITAAVHENPDYTIEKESPKFPKMIRIQLKTLPLVMTINPLKNQEK